MNKISLTEWTRWRMVCALLLCAGLAAFSLRAEELTVIRGASAKIAVPEGIRKIIIGSDGVIDARPQEDGRVALVVGLAEGTSELRIERLQGPDMIYKVAVRADLQGTVDQIKELLSDVVGLEIKTVGSKIVFEGKIKTQADWEKVKKVQAAYAGVIIDLATFDQPEMAEAVKTVILKDLRDIGVDTVTVQVTGDTVILDGVTYSDADMQRAIEKARLRMPNVKSLLRVQQLMIETDLQFVEVDRENDSSFGNNILNNTSLSGAFSAANSGKPSLSMGAATTGTINAQLTVQNSKTIYQDHLTGASGQEVSFKKGDTSYFSIPGNVGGSLVPVSYGVIIKVKPTMVGRDRIMTEVSVEVSAPVVGGAGALTVSEFKTTTSIMSKVGETVVLSGFAQALGTQNDNKTPVLGDIPLLNLMFANKNKSKSKKDGLLLLTPRPSFPETATGPAYSEQAKDILKDAGTK